MFPTKTMKAPPSLALHAAPEARAQARTGQHSDARSELAQTELVQPDFVQPSFQEVYSAHFDFVWRCAAHRGVDRAALDDVVQEVFIIVHRKLPEFEGRSSVRTWLGGIARRVVSDFVKKRGNRPAGDADLEQEAIAGAGAGDPLEQRAAVALLDALLSKMPEEQREVFVLRELEGLSGADIAAITETNENTVWTRLRAARRTFQEGVARARARDEWEPA